MKSLFIFLLFIFSFSLTQAQNLTNSQLDSLYNEFLQIKRYPTEENNRNILSEDTTHIKCAFGIVNAIRMNFNRYTPKQKMILKLLLSRPVTDTSFVTPNGFFRVHYDLSGSNAPTYSLDSLAIALDSSYNFEVNYLGYPPPPPDNGKGGDNKYDIYIENLGNTYGFTNPEDQIPGTNRYTSYMEIDNDFSGFYTTGINAARVTVAHEFHHSIQVGDYIDRYGLDEFFYELTSTSMEHFVYPSIHDYYQYLPSYFNNTQYGLGENGGTAEYALAIWNIYLQENFGYDIIKKQWQLMPQMRALQAIANSIADYNSSLGVEFNKFGIWTFFTNYRAVQGKYFISAKDYPVIKPIVTLSYSPPSKTVQLTTFPVTNSFIQFVNSSNLDTLVTLITNADVSKGIDSTNSEIPFEYSLLSQSENGAVKLTNDYYQKFNTVKPAFWLTGEFLNNQVIQIGQYIAENADYAFPSPFYYNKNAYIYIPAIPNASGSADLNVYSASMKLVFSAYEHIVYISGQKVIRWDGLDKNNSKLSSGVYLYITKSGNNTTKGKLVIFND